MHIDWLTVGAQVINFFVLVWLLKRYLYQPVLDAIAAREARTAGQLADAAAKQTLAAQGQARFERLSADLAAQRAGLLQKARQEAEVAGRTLLADARQAADALRVERENALRSEVDAMGSAMGRRVCEQVIGIARKTLSDLAGADLDARIGALFARRLLALEPDARARLTAAPGVAAGGACVRSAFVLPQAQRQAIEDALAQVLAAVRPIRFEVVPELIGGIELVANGQEISWNIADYVTNLGHMATDAFEKAGGDPLPAGTMGTVGATGTGLPPPQPSP